MRCPNCDKESKTPASDGWAARKAGQVWRWFCSDSCFNKPLPMCTICSKTPTGVWKDLPHTITRAGVKVGIVPVYFCSHPCRDVFCENLEGDHTKYTVVNSNQGGSVIEVSTRSERICGIGLCTGRTSEAPISTEHGSNAICLSHRQSLGYTQWNRMGGYWEKPPQERKETIVAEQPQLTCGRIDRTTVNGHCSSTNNVKRHVGWVEIGPAPSKESARFDLNLCHNHSLEFIDNLKAKNPNLKSNEHGDIVSVLAVNSAPVYTNPTQECNIFGCKDEAAPTVRYEGVNQTMCVKHWAAYISNNPSAYIQTADGISTLYNPAATKGKKKAKEATPVDHINSQPQGIIPAAPPTLKERFATEVDIVKSMTAANLAGGLIRETVHTIALEVKEKGNDTMEWLGLLDQLLQTKGGDIVIAGLLGMSSLYPGLDSRWEMVASGARIAGMSSATKVVLDLGMSEVFTRLRNFDLDSIFGKKPETNADGTPKPPAALPEGKTAILADLLKTANQTVNQPR